VSIAFVASASNTVQNPATSLACNKPTGTADGHVLLAYLATQALGANFDVTVTPPSGWTLVVGGNDLGASTSIRLDVYVKVAASEGSSWTWNYTAPSGAHAAIVVQAWSGVDTTTPIVSGEAAYLAQVASSGTRTTSSITTAGTRQLLAAWADRNGSTFTISGTSRGTATLAVSACVATEDAGSQAAGTYSRTATGAAVTSVAGSAILALQEASSAIPATVTASGEGTSVVTAVRSATAFTVAASGSGTAIPTVTQGLILCMAGAPTSSGFATVAKTTGTTARMAVSVNSDLSSASYTSAQTPDVYGYTHHAATGLTANTQYYWAIEHDGHLDLGKQGMARTLPTVGSLASFSFWVGSCHDWIGSNVYEHIRTKTGVGSLTALFGSHLGDMGYPYIGSGGTPIAPANTATLVADRELTITGPLPMRLYREIPIHHTYSDCDGAGSNSDGTWVGFTGGNVQAAYRAQFPNPTLPLADTQARSWVVGRVRFIQTDELTMASARGATDNSSKSKLGTAQKAWFKAEIDAAEAAQQAVVWLGDGGWLGAAATGGTNSTWTAYSTERTELGTYIAGKPWVSDHIVRAGGDIHTLFADSGANNSWGGFPTTGNAPMSTTANTYGQTVSDGKWPTSSGSARQYGWYDVTDAGGTLTIDYNGMAYDSGTTTWIERVSMTMTWTMPVSVAASGSGTSVATVVPGQRLNISASGSGTSVVTSVPSQMVTVTASGTGTASVTATRSATALTVAASGDGTTVVTAGQVQLATATASGSGTASITNIRPGHSISATASGTGTGGITLLFKHAHADALAASGSGTATVTVAPGNRLSITASGSGTLVGTVAPHLVVTRSVSASGEGTAVLDVVPAGNQEIIHRIPVRLTTGPERGTTISITRPRS
jgi:alkaline phosphatase D